MVERIRDLLLRFPENEEAVKALITIDQEFNSLCQEYSEINQELRLARKERRPDPELDIASLGKRRCAVEETLLRKIEGYEPL